jgi:hypothetical protein
MVDFEPRAAQELSRGEPGVIAQGAFRRPAVGPGGVLRLPRQERREGQGGAQKKGDRARSRQASVSTDFAHEINLPTAGGGKRRTRRYDDSLTEA